MSRACFPRGRGPVTSDGIGAWFCNDNAASTVVTDSSGSANHGTATDNTSALSTTGPGSWGANTALAFNGTTQYVNLGDILDASIAGAATRIFTFAAWIYPTSLGTRRYILGKWNDTGNLREYQFYLETTDKLGITVCSDPADATSYIRRFSALSIPITTWTHVVAVVNLNLAAYSRLKVYVNGQDNDGGTEAGLTGFGGSITDTAGLLALGSAHGGAAVNLFAGSLSDMRVYNAALGANEIAAHYMAGAPRTSMVGAM